MSPITPITSEPARPAPGEPASGPTSTTIAEAGGVDPAIMAAAKEFEAVFLGEMLRQTGLADAPESFGGGIGEDRFAGLLIDEYARSIASSHSFGIADRVYRVLLERAGV